MKRPALHNHFGHLSAEERFKLIFRAGARGDHEEQKLLVQGSPSVTCQVAAHTPAALAFADLATHIFQQALETAHRYDEQRREIITMILRHAIRDRADRSPTKDGPPPDGPIPKPGQRTRCEAARHVEDRAVDLMMALACEFRQLVRGWSSSAMATVCPRSCIGAR
jgi:hypothetical protein